MAQGDSFAATVGQWCEDVQEASEAIFQEAAQALVHELDDLLSQLVYSNPATDYQRTNFLRASLVASNTVMPVLNRPNPGVPVPVDYGETLLVINSTELGTPLFLGYSSEYAAFVHFGTAKMAGRPWVQMVAQRWEALVSQAEANVRSRFGL